MKEKASLRNFHGIIGLLVLLIAEICMFMQVEPFVSWFYPFAWWSYILIVDSIIYRIKGNSLIVSRTREFFLMVFWSTIIWLFFELINLSIKNWYYINVTNILWIRWIGYAISFGTVLPGIFETMELLESSGMYRTTSIKKITINAKWYIILFSLGMVCLISPIFFPKYCYPLVWGSLIFLLEPVIYKLEGRSLLREWERGNPEKFYLLLTAGLICGFLWEFWNFWASTKWIYTVPFFDEIKLFEMPLMGFLGFPPFAVECYVIYNFISLFRHGCGWEIDSYRVKPEKKVGKIIMVATSLVGCGFCLFMFQALDLQTVKSYSNILEEYKFISPTNLEKFRELNIFTSNDLLKRVETDEELRGVANKLSISPQKLDKWINWFELIQVKGIGWDNFLLLRKAEVDSLRKLAGQDPDVLFSKLKKINPDHSFVKDLPDKAMVKVWIMGARRISDQDD